MKAFFPWRLFWKFFFTLVLLLNLLFLTSLAVAAQFIHLRLYSTEPLIVAGIFFLLSLIGAAAFSYRFSSPLRRVILKALRLANKKQVADEQDVEEVLEEEPGEYFELEMALDKIRRKMKKRRIQLAHEREESQALMSSLEDAILSIDIGFKVKFYNSRFANQFLERSQGELLLSGESVPLAQIFREPQILNLFKLTLSKGESQSQRLSMYSLIDKQMKFYSIKVSALREEKTGVVYGAMAVFHDVSDLKLAEQIRIEFVENASHELRTPLTSIKGFVDTAKEDIQEGKTDQMGYFLGVISKNVDRLTELVNDMLTLSILESGGGVKRESIRAEELTQDLVERVSSMASEKQILIKVFCESSPFLADIGKVEQVLENLVTNAIKYIPSGGQVQVKWLEDKNFVSLYVIDNGPGIAEIHLKRLFERFYRIDKGRSRDVGGTGLGLSIVKHIMQSHGGSVQVKSEIGKGSEFICTFPK